MDSLIWCPYTDKDLPLHSCSPEHIVPLALGGSDKFTIPVSRAANSNIGSDIDGALAKDPFLSFARQTYDARGHRDKKSPEVIFKNAKFKGEPVQVRFPGKGESPIIWNAKTRENFKLEEIINQKFEVTLKFDRYVATRFISKVALSAGYLIYGETFRNLVAHSDLRVMMNAKSPHELREVATSIKTTVHQSHDPHPVPRVPLFDAGHFVATHYDGASIFFVPSDGCLTVIVGVLRTYVGSLNIPAETATFPLEGEHDLGHCIFIKERKLQRLSFRECIGMVLKQLPPEELI